MFDSPLDALNKGSGLGGDSEGRTTLPAQQDTPLYTGQVEVM